ncbi:unnamed protein product, partial [marine sediment metagenome]
MISALIIKYLKEHASGPILALDADPDSNLATVLGIPMEKTIGDLREQTLKEIKNLPAGMSKSGYIEAGLHEIIVETEKVDLITMGRSEGPGCYCYINNLLRKFADDLQSSYDWVVMDNEAGMEHLSRRTASKVDSLIVVVNQSPLSIDCAKRIVNLISDLKKEVARKYLLINFVDENKIDSVRKKIEGIEIEYLGYVPHDAALEANIFNGDSFYNLDNTPAVLKIEEIMSKIS